MRSRLLPLLLTLALPLAPSCIAELDDEDAADADFLVAGKADSAGLPATAAAALLRLVNASSFSQLDDQVGLSRTAARNLIAHRAGADGASGTRDDDLFDSLEEVDAVPYVGPRAFELLVAAAEAVTDDLAGALWTPGWDTASGAEYRAFFHGLELSGQTGSQVWSCAVRPAKQEVQCNWNSNPTLGVPVTAHLAADGSFVSEVSARIYLRGQVLPGQEIIVDRLSVTWTGYQTAHHGAMEPFQLERCPADPRALTVGMWAECAHSPGY